MKKLILIFLTTSGFLLHNQTSVAQTLTEAQWQEDIEHVKSKFESRHIAPYHSNTKETMDSLFQSLINNVSKYNREEILVGIAKAIAKIGDGHTAFWLYPTKDNKFTRLPISIYIFKNDEWRIIGASDDCEDILGGQILKINGIDIQEVFKRLKTITPSDNEMTHYSVCPRYATIPQLLKGLNISDDLASVTFDIKMGEQIISKKIYAKNPAELPSFAYLRFDYDENSNFLTASNDQNIPFWLKEKPSLWFSPKGKNFWFHFDKQSGTAYINITRFADMNNERIEVFYKKIFAQMDSLEVNKLVLDIRLHGGGNNYFTKPLLLEILSRPKLNKPGKFFVIIGRRTFSAGMHLATKLELYSNATFVGEPTGGSPNHYADNRGSRMPNSRLPVHFSTMYWQNAQPFPHEKRKSQNPDVYTPLTFDAYKNNIDPALQAIEEFKYFPPIYDRLLAIDSTFSEINLTKMWSDFKDDSKNKYLLDNGILDMLWYANEQSLEKNYERAHLVYGLVYTGNKLTKKEIKSISGVYNDGKVLREISYKNGMFFYNRKGNITQLVPVGKFKFHFLWKPGVVTELNFIETKDKLIMEMIEEDGTISFNCSKEK